MPSLSPAYAPPGESAADLYLERTILDGTSVLSVAYGVFFVLFCQCAALLLGKAGARSQRRWALVAYIFVDFALITIFTGGEIKYNELTFVDQRNIPGGPDAFSIEYFGYSVSMMANTVFVLSNWLADGLLLYRFIMIWNYRYWMIIIPCLMWLASMATSIVLLVLIERPDSGFWSAKAVQFGIAYWSLTIALNFLITILICVRLFAARKNIQGVMGSGHGKMYLSMSAMLVESAALYSIWGMVFLITYARNDPFQDIVCPALCPIQGIASILIILRVAKGTAFSPDSNATSMTGMNSGVSGATSSTQVTVSKISETTVNFAMKPIAPKSSRTTVDDADLHDHDDKEASLAHDDAPVDHKNSRYM